MPKLHMFRAGLIAGIVLSATAAFPAGAAQAAAPAFHDKIRETVPDVEICGFVGTLRVTGSQVFSLTDTRLKVTGQITEVFTIGNGNTATIKNAGQFTSTFRSQVTSSPLSIPTKGCRRGFPPEAVGASSCATPV